MLIFRQKQAGFTIVELLIVIVVIAILATISIVAYNGMQRRATTTIVSSDLSSAAKAFELYKVDNGSYPTDMPASVKTSENVILSATSTTDGSFCINAYHSSDPSLKLSWDSNAGGLQNKLCSGAVVGNPAGGGVPLAARGINLAPDFSQWELTGSAAYNSGTGELTFGASTGSAVSPLIKVDEPASMYVGGDMYATVASASDAHAPLGAFHGSIRYYESDGVTPVTNSWGYTGNGCARSINLNVWNNSVQECGYGGGPGVVYVTFVFTGPSGGRTSSDIRIKNPLLIAYD